MQSSDDDLVQQIYAAGLVPQQWSVVFETLSDRLRSRGGSLFVLSEGELAWTAPAATRAVMEAYVEGGWDKRNDRLDRLLAAAHPGFLQETDLFSPAELDRLPIVRDFLLPNDVAATAATVVGGANGDLAVFSVDRGKAGGRFSPEETAWLDGLRPHLARSVALASRLRLREAATATAALQLVGIPAAILSDRQRVLSTNALFDQLAGSTFLPAAFGHLSLADKRAERMLRGALAEARRAETVRSIAVRGHEPGAGGILHVIPAHLEAGDVLGTGTTLVVFARPKASASVAPDWLQGLYDLTPAEARIGARLAAGSSIKEVAAETGNSEHTVRSQVKGLLQKTGCSRQIDFVRAISSLSDIKPALRHKA